MTTIAKKLSDERLKEMRHVGKGIRSSNMHGWFVADELFDHIDAITAELAEKAAENERMTNELAAAKQRIAESEAACQHLAVMADAGLALSVIGARQCEGDAAEEERLTRELAECKQRLDSLKVDPTKLEELTHKAREVWLGRQFEIERDYPFKADWERVVEFIYSAGRASFPEVAELQRQLAEVNQRLAELTKPADDGDVAYWRGILYRVTLAPEGAADHLSNEQAAKIIADAIRSKESATAPLLQQIAELTEELEATQVELARPDANVSEEIRKRDREWATALFHDPDTMVSMSFGTPEGCKRYIWARLDNERELTEYWGTLRKRAIRKIREIRADRDRLAAELALYQEASGQLSNLVDEFDSTLEDEETSHQDTIRLWDISKKRLATTKQALAEARAEVERVSGKLEDAMILLRDVYRQAGNGAPGIRRHALTPNLRDAIRDFIQLAEVSALSHAPAQPAASEPADDDDMTDWDRFDESQQAARASEPGDAAEKVEPVKPLRSVDEVLAEINSPEEAMKELRIEQSDDRCDEQEPAERRFVCPICKAIELRVAYSTEWRGEGRTCAKCEHGGPLREFDTAEVEAAKGDGVKTIGEESGESCSRCGRANTWHPDCPTCRKLMLLEQQLAAANQAREAAEQRAECAEQSRVRIMQTYDPNCDVFVEADEIQKMHAVRQSIEALQELAEFLGSDPEGCLTDAPDAAMGRINDAEQRAEAAEAAAGVMLEMLKATEHQLLRFGHGFWECNCRERHDGTRCNKHELAGRITRTIKTATDPGRAANELLALRAFRAEIEQDYQAWANATIGDNELRIRLGVARNKVDQALAQGEQRGEGCQWLS